MKQSPDLDRVQARMLPGEITLHGFLGTDDRKLVDILAADNEAVAVRGITHVAIANALAELTEKGRDIMEGEILVDERYAVKVRDDRGLIPSPWGDGLFEKGDVEMLDRQTGKTFRWNGLTLHMIRNHGFYSGKGAAYRIEPADIIESLALKPVEE